MNVLDLFSGIGGFSLGLEAAGMRTIAFCERDSFCQKVLRHHWPSTHCHSDIRELDAGQYRGSIDVVCGGFPCQDISPMGKRAGICGRQSGLWTEFFRTIREIRPRFVIVENSSMLINSGIGVVVGDLASIRYDAEWDCLPASAFGAPHVRDRAWIIAYPTEKQRLHQSYFGQIKK